MPVMMLPSAPGKCQFCAGDHKPTEPHNRDSLYYQMRFNGIYGRWPTWADAVAHCSSILQAAWQAELERRGVWSAPKEGEPIQEIDRSGVPVVPMPIPMPHLEPKVVKFQPKKRKAKIKKKTKKKGL